MNKELGVVNKKLKIYFAFALLVSITTFLLVLYYVTENNILADNVILERYGIMFTLIGIPFSLWFFYSQLKKTDTQNNILHIQKYKKLYLIRLGILSFVCFFNIFSLYITGAKNFIFMIIITIFAFLLCFPQKELEIKRNDENKEDIL